MVSSGMFGHVVPRTFQIDIIELCETCKLHVIKGFLKMFLMQCKPPFHILSSCKTYPTINGAQIQQILWENIFIHLRCKGMFTFICIYNNFNFLSLTTLFSTYFNNEYKLSTSNRQKKNQSFETVL